MRDLPRGWAWATLGELGRWIGGGTPSKSVPAYWSGDIPWVSPKDMKVSRITDAADHISPTAVEESSTNLVPVDSVLVVTRSGILRHTLPIATTEREVALNQDLKALIPEQGIEPGYVAWAMRASADLILRECSKAGTTVSNIETPRLLSFEIPLAPLAEQRRIVAAIEEHLLRLAAAQRTLLRCRRSLASFSAASLGTLAKLGLNERGTRRMKVVDIGTSGEQTALTGPFGATLGREDFRPAGVPVITISALQGDGIDHGKLRYISEEKAEELGRYELASGDLLFSRMASVGRVGLVEQSLVGAIFNYHIIRLRLDPKIIDPRYFILYARGSSVVRDYLRSVNRGATRDGINTSLLLEMPIDVPPLDVQRNVAERAERLIEIEQLVIRGVRDAETRSEALRAALLRRAFRGELVPQDPHDEPASALLERIDAERAAAPKPTRKRRERSPA